MHCVQPADCRLRPATYDDVDAVCDVINAYSLDLLGVGSDLRCNLISTWETPGFSMETDTCVALSAEGVILGYAEVEDTEEPHVILHSWMRVHPTSQKRAVGHALLSWIEERALQSVTKAPKGARVAVRQGMPDLDTDAGALLEDHGFRVVRAFQRMTIDLDAEIREPLWPAGIEIKTLDLEKDLAETVHVIRDTFADHWGHVEKPFEEELAQWNHRFRSDPEFDASLCHLAFAEGSIVAYSLCEATHPEDSAMGVVGVLGVARAWRRRGLALALLNHSFRVFKERGRERVCLGVDATSLTGAHRLYGAAGMVPTRHFNTYEKELRAGRDLTLQALEQKDDES